ncbi:putative invasin [Salmonella enterica]|uniref:Putative invasin n=1 Tax=Salmonella enterica TaxID=28901 RepID=A0A379SI07_SALER|nr:putative invasin [Salmonella enterica]SUG27884.1 putative invasin [Salmonella enterica]
MMKHTSEKITPNDGQLRPPFRRTLLFAAMLQASLPALTACGDTVTRVQADQKAQAARDPFRADHPHAAAHPGDNLPSLGTDPADRPAPPPDELKAARAKKQAEQAMHPAQQNQDAGATALASAATTAAGLMQTPDAARAAAAMAKGMAEGAVTGRINQTAQDWLSHFGNARVQLNIDETLSLRDSSFDLLHPWWETPENMVFSQASLHRNDDRNQTNLGLGWRHWGKAGPLARKPWRGDYMVGLNAFLDYDLSRDHARWGLGGEYWRNDFKLDANTYLRLTNWKDSPDLEDYEERPADGWDVRAQGWLPSYPQLGAKLSYEQYYGHDVGLFGYDHLQKDPHAFTAGLTWTPVPLLTFSAEQRQGKQGENDTRIGLDITLNPDLTWQQQTDPSAVAAMRSLAGSRHDFVERNNNIVLEYRKKEVIAIDLPERLEGKSGLAVPLNVTVSKAKYGLQNIVWDDASLLAAGGLLTCPTTTDCSVTMPPFHPGGNNTWIVSAVAHDRKGNTSKPAQTAVVVTGVGVSTTKSTLTPGVQNLLADGKSQTTITAVLKAEDGQPVTGLADQLALSGTLTPDSNVVDVKTVRNRAATPAPAAPVPGRMKETTPGTYVAPLTAGTTGGKYALSLAYAGTPLLTADMTLADTLADISGSTLTTDKPVITASTGSSRATLTVHLRDKNGKPVTGEASQLSLTALFPKTVPDGQNNVVIGHLSPVTGTPGDYQATLSSTQATTTDPAATAPAKDGSDALTIALKVNGKDAGKTVALVVIPDKTSVSPVLTVNVNKQLANNTAQDSFRVVTEDANHNLVRGQTVQLATKAGAADKVTFVAPGSGRDAATFTTGNTGEAMQTLTAAVPGDKVVNATVNGNTGNVTVNFQQDKSLKVTGVTVNGGAGGSYCGSDTCEVGVTDKSKVSLSATVVNGSGQPVVNIPVSWTLDKDSTCRVDTDKVASLGASGDGVMSAVSDSGKDGHATVLLHSAGDHKTCKVTVTAAVKDGDPTKTSAITITWIAEKESARVSALMLNPDNPSVNQFAIGTEDAPFRATVGDQYGNPVQGASLRPDTASLKHATISAQPGATNADGNTTLKLKDGTVEDVTLSASVDKAGTVTPSIGNSPATANGPAHFVANAAAAEVTTLDVTDADTGGKAITARPVGDGSGHIFYARATVKDKASNVVKAPVNWVLNLPTGCTGSDVVLKDQDITSDTSGTAKAKIISAGTHQVCDGFTLTASTGRSTSTPLTSGKLSYTPDQGTAHVATLAQTNVKTPNNFTAGETDTTKLPAYKVTVTDQYRNPVNNAAIDWTSDNPGGTAFTTTAGSVTDTTGSATNTLKGTVVTTAPVKVTAKVDTATTGATGTPDGGQTTPVGVNFVADAKTLTLTGTTTGDRKANATATGTTAATADGKDLLTLHLTAVSKTGNVPVPNVAITFAGDWNKAGNVTKGDGSAIANGTVACTTGATGSCDVALKTVKVNSTSATSGDNIPYTVGVQARPAGAQAAVTATVPALFLAGPVDAAHTTVSLAAGSRETLVAQHADQVVELNAKLGDANGNPVPVWMAAPQLVQPNGLGVSISPETGTGQTDAVSWKLNAGGLHAPYMTQANMVYEVRAKDGNGTVAKVMDVPGEIPVLPTFTALIAPEARWNSAATGTGASIADTALALIPEKGLSDGDEPLSQFVIAENVNGYAGYYPAWERTGTGQGYFRHKWYPVASLNGPVPKTVKVCLRRQPTTMKSGNGCRDLQLLGAGGADPWPRVPVTVDIPRLTVYLGPIYDESRGQPDTVYARKPDDSLHYGDVGCGTLLQPFDISGHEYAYKKKTLGTAPSPLVGTAAQRSDYNFAEGQVAVGSWIVQTIGGTATGHVANSPASVWHDRLWADGTHRYPDGSNDPADETTLTARTALAPVAAPYDDVNYVAGWRHGTSDHSVAMINVRAGATAGTAMAQPNGTKWAAGGIVCVLDRQ